VTSPLLSNLVVDELDRELERRGLRFVRYADDSNIYVGSERAGLRVMESITRRITHRLKLKVNQAKSAVADRGEESFSDSSTPSTMCSSSDHHRRKVHQVSAATSGRLRLMARHRPLPLTIVGRGSFSLP
jgi:Reverse transcriptase (RNA-dependent DNA polymerase)